MQTKRGIIVGAFGVVMALAFLANAVAAAPARADIRVYANDAVWASFDAADLKGGPEVSLDKIFIFPDNPGLIPVAEASPGDRDYNGGRWEVHAVSFTGMAPEQFTNDEVLWFHYALGHLTISGTLRTFECPLIKL